VSQTCAVVEGAGGTGVLLSESGAIRTVVTLRADIRRVVDDSTKRGVAVIALHARLARRLAGLVLGIRNTNGNHQQSIINKYLSSHMKKLTVVQVKRLLQSRQGSVFKQSWSTLDRVSFSVKTKSKFVFLLRCIVVTPKV
jgi:hypothetical protein